MAIQSHLYPYKLHTLPSGVSQTGISPPSSRLRTASNVTWAEGKSWKCWGVFWMSVLLFFFFGVGQTLKRIVNTKWAVVTSHIRACLYFILKKSLEILYFTSESTTSKLHPAHHWWVFCRERFPPRRTSPSSCHVMLGFRAPTFLCQKSTKIPEEKKKSKKREKKPSRGHLASTGPDATGTSVSLGPSNFFSKRFLGTRWLHQLQYPTAATSAATWGDRDRVSVGWSCYG